MSKNTLFNYFTKSGSTNKATPSPSVNSADSPKTPALKRKHHANSKTKSPGSNLVNGSGNKSTPASKKKKEEIKYKSDSEEEVKTPPEKRKRVFMIDSEGDASEDEFKPEEHKESSEDESLSEVEESEPETAYEDDGTPVKKSRAISNPRNRKPKKTGTTTITPAKTKGVMQPSTAHTPGAKEPGVDSQGDNWPHLKYEFMQPNRIKDIKMKPASHPEYNPRTLHVPNDFKSNQTPAMRQWWELKEKHFDCVLFFKVGKFYELYHMDAVTSANELNLLYMKGDFAHTGFPEVAYGKYAALLVDKGYKVARVEQTETPDMVEKRCKTMGKPTKFDRVVKREICQLTSKGTRVFSVQDGEAVEPDSSYLLALTEKEGEGGKREYGVCFVDTSIAIFHLGQFTDDRHCSRLRTLFAHHPPAQVLYERGQLSCRTLQVLNTVLATALKEHLAPDLEFWSSTKTLTTLTERKYFPQTPDGLKPFLSNTDSLGLTANDDADLAVRALGAITWDLSRCLLDQQLLSLGQFTEYRPSDTDRLPELSAGTPDTITSRHMVLDSVSLKNLNVLDNSCGSTTGTLLWKLDHCSTPMGKRLLYQWICSPLTSVASIEARQRAVTELIGQPGIVKDIRALMAKMPDLERLLTRIFAQSSQGLSANHPESRAIFFEEKTYSKKKIVEFIAILNGFHTAQKIAETFQSFRDDLGDSEMLIQCFNFPSLNPPGQFPDLTENLNFFKNAFDHEEAGREGHIIPSPGVDPDYDYAINTLKQLSQDQQDYLRKQCDFFKSKVSYVGTDKKRFQLEVRESADRKITSGYQLQGQRKGFKRYTTDKTKVLLEEQMSAEEKKKNALHGLRKRIFSRFSEQYSDWTQALQCIAILDVLMSFAECSQGQEGNICIPEFVKPDKCVQPFVELRSGSFPCSARDEVFIPNDTVIGDCEKPAPSLILLTGPNMGGKSTLMRQLALIVIMAQLGCRVPAEKLRLSPVDRIFTRIGANDDIMAGESTFYTELCETSAILAHATKHALVLVDELGRGTSTYDGTAIAHAVLLQLSTIKCRTLFSTHYHSLVEDFKECEAVALGHMACMAESDMGEDGDGLKENITFLYKFAPGACPKSYGFNAARLAGLPADIIKVGYARAKALEEECNLRKTFQQIFRKDFDATVVRQLMNSL